MLEGDLESNLQRLAAFCFTRRLLLVIAGDHAERARFFFGGLSSTLLSPPLGAAPEKELQRIQRALSSAAPADDWATLCRLARQGRRLTREQGRIAECYELIEQWYAAAESRADYAVLDEAAREMVWILESWGRSDAARRLEYYRLSEFGDQMMLHFEAVNQ